MKKLPILLLFTLFMALGAAAQQRIVTAGSSSSEIVCALGSCDQIVATDRTSLYPSRLQALPSIGYRTSISAEGILAQKPDLLIFEEEYVKEELVAQLSSTGIPLVVVKQEGTLASTHDRIRTIAAALGKEKEGEALIVSIDQGLEKVKEKVAAAGNAPTVLCVYNRGRGNMMVAGKNTSFSLLDAAGVKNAVPEIDGYKPLNAEALIQANPDYILFFESGLQSLGGVDEVLKIPGVLQTTAGKKKQIIAMDGIFLTNWGPRVAEAAMELFTLTHPENTN